MDRRTAPEAPREAILYHMPRPRSLAPTLLALALLAAMLAPAIADARCMAGLIDAWPPPETALPTTPMILLDGFGNEQPHIAALAEGGTAQLVAGSHRVALVVEAIHVGDFGLTQAVLKPAEPLKPSTKYTLVLRGADKQRVRTRTFSGGDTKAIGWTTAAARPAPLALTGAPAVTGQSFQRFGCGPASHVEVSLPATAGTPIAVEVTLREEGAEAARSYVVPVRDGVLAIGHGMCSGAFRLTGPERRFTAELTVRDAAGDAIAVPDAIRFDGVHPSPMFGKGEVR